ncbi:MAG: type II toxin-antitoxin system HicB family antitoxin [Microcystis aeruginosa LG13-03]|nr:type II toxin-antitoxin system HicB family antitoxin [Microcystis aeruginosa LG13-13]NCR04724.1 type II toxin-antitoxin system HicB family antitoxin [Microcystis aeruginosa LG13-03]NCR62963.1 type II toxin-antitoxin system HicB family antitoxin [Microcystis aeruginosa LG11-05]
MNTFTAVVEKDFDTNLYVGYVPDFPGANSQEAIYNGEEVIEMYLEAWRTEGEVIPEPRTRSIA